MSPKKGAR